MQLYIGNKNYSSWSLRAWLLMRHAEIAFEEIQLRLDSSANSPFKTALAPITPAGRVPVLVDDGFAVWDTLAIAEYLAERFSEKQLWPIDRHDRARARSLCAEMHGGFQALRNHCGMNIEADLAEVGARLMRDVPGVADDLARIHEMWESALAQSGGPFLFGRFSVADAYFAPVCSRIRTFALPVTARVLRYVDYIIELPAMRAWCLAARQEHDFIVEDELYRSPGVL